jgi:hypothetical protein
MIGKKNLKLQIARASRPTTRSQMRTCHSNDVVCWPLAISQ